MINFKLLIVLYCLLLLSCNKEKIIKDIIITPKFIDDVVEVGSTFIITKDTSIIFSSNANGKYNLKQYKNGNVTDLLKSNKNIFSPFIFKNKIIGLTDNNGNEKFCPTDNRLKKLLQEKPIRRIESSIDGEIIIFQYADDSRIHLIDTNKNKIKEIGKIKDRYHGSFFYNKKRGTFISYDCQVIKYDERKNIQKELKIKLRGEKRTIYIYENELFFSNEEETEFRQIYKIDLEKEEKETVLVHRSANNIMTPKYDGNYLYFIECEKNEYLLKRKKIGNNRIETLTNKGVIYKYNFWGNNKIALIYSDFNTPRALLIYDIEKRTMRNISGKSFNFKADFKYEPMSFKRSPAYIISQKSENQIKGIILFFHPGLHNDFSPRWDTILMALLKSGYMIIAPNYPMSKGYGKHYRNLSIKDAIGDMINWKNYINRRHKKVNIYYMAASSGNLLMEKCLLKETENVKGAVSLFGLYNNNAPINNIPALYILGENDPKINFKKRKNALMLSNIEILSFPDEGHWLRNNKNIKTAVKNILEFFRRI